MHRPWVAEPGLWRLRYPFGDGPVVDGVKMVLFVAWLAWSRFRVVIALRDKTQPVGDRRVGPDVSAAGWGADVSVDRQREDRHRRPHRGGAGAEPEAVTFGRHYGITVLTCEPADPASKGGVEASVKISKADPVPTETNLRAGYGCFTELEQACTEFMTQVNSRVHRVTRRAPGEMLAEERARLHRVPDVPHTVVFGLARRVRINTPMVAFEHGQNSFPGSSAVSRCGSAPPGSGRPTDHHRAFQRVRSGGGRPACPRHPRPPPDQQ